MKVKEMEKVKQRAHEAFISFKGVLGVGYGLKRVEGKETRVTAVIVFVEKKLPKEEVREGELIPKSFEGFPTDVEEVIFDHEKFAKDETGTYEGDPMGQFLDWAKIHRLTEEQHKREKARTGKTSSRKTKTISDSPQSADTPPPTVEVRGNLFIIEDHGTLTLTTSLGEKIIDLVGAWQIFRGLFGDDYDFCAFFLDDTDASFPDMGNASDAIFHDAAENGFGTAACNNRASWNNSTRLLRYVYHSWYSLRTMLHEVGHQWLYFVNYRNSANGAEQTLLHESWSSTWKASQKWYHPGMWPDGDLSCMSYARHDWIEIAAGNPGVYRWQAINPQNIDGSLNMAAPDADFNFSPLEQYLMGLVNPEVVASSRVDPPAYPASGGNYQIINNPTERTDGDYDSTPVTITPQNIIWNEGTRTPDHHNSQRVFHEAIIAITYNRNSSAQFLADSETRRANQAINWRRATAGRSVIDTSILRNNINDIYIRDNINDTGGSFPGGGFWNSPDIFVRTQADDPNLYSDPTIPNDTIHQKAKSNQDNWIYARISNKSAMPYENVTVNFYLANYKGFSGRDTAAQAIPRTEVIYPIDWHPESLLGSATLPSVPAGGTAVARIVWPQNLIPPKADWHPCLLVEIVPLGTAPNKLHNVWDNKKLAQKNITIDYISADMKDFEIPFLIGHQESKSPYALVEVVKPAEAELQVYLDPGEFRDDELKEIDGKLYHRIDGLEPKEVEELIESNSVATACHEDLFVKIPRNTMIELGTACSCDELRRILQVVFCDDTRLVLKNRGIDIYRLGFMPLEGFKLERVGQRNVLRITDPVKAQFPVSLKKERSHEMRLIISSNGQKLKQDTTLHVMQRNDKGRVVGGIAVQLRNA
jgi:hypothetical protein